MSPQVHIGVEWMKLDRHASTLDTRSARKYAIKARGCNERKKGRRALTHDWSLLHEYVSKTDEKSKKIAKGKSGLNQTSRTPENSRESEEPTPEVLYGDTDTIVITVVFDVVGRLVELLFEKCLEIPRLLIKIIGLCIPYQTFLSKITIRRVRLKGEILYEVAKFLPQSSCLTDISLDDSPIPQRNYYLLFDLPQIKRLSLARCNIDDEDCVMIALKLTHPLPAATHLIILSLVSNNISDVGAAALGEALRSNRSLQYLNLSGNLIMDYGATAILESLMQFNLTQDELMTKRQRLMEYLRVKREVFNKCLKELITASEKPQDEYSRSSKRKQTIGRKKTSMTATSMGVGQSSMDTIIFKAETMTDELIGIYADPFSINETELRDNCVYSLGNMTLCYLNLSHNRLSYTSLLVLVQVLKYQSLMTQKSGTGLLRVIVDGNDLPIVCSEYSIIDELLDKAIMWKIAKSVKRVERTKSKVK